MSMSGLEVLARIGGERVLNSVPQGLLIAAVARLLLRFFARKNSATRFLVWFVALLAIAATPFLPDLTRGQLHALGYQIGLSDSWAGAVIAAWLAIATVVTVRFALGLWRLRRLRRSCVPISSSNRARELQEELEHFAASTKVSLCVSKDVSVPAAIGFFNPVIVLPEYALLELTADELKVILLHEFAHLRRLDQWTNLAQRLIRTIFFFHPAVIWIDKHLSLEREIACDDAVLAETSNPRAYAECLVKVAEKILSGRQLAMAQAVIGHARQTCLRFARILDANRPTSTSARKPALAISSVLAVLCLAVLPHVPRLVAVEGPAPAPVFTSSTGVAPRALVVPAAMRTEAVLPVARTDASAVLPANARASAAHGRHSFMQTVSRRERMDRVYSRSSLLAPAAVKQTRRPTEFLVFVRAAQFGEGEPVVMSISVWRFTPVPVDAARRQSIAKST